MSHQQLTLFDDGMQHENRADRLRRPEAVTSREALHSSQSVEWYTPARYVEAVRMVLGSIDLGPASCAFANETIGAKRYHNLEQMGWRMTGWVRCS